MDQTNNTSEIIRLISMSQGALLGYILTLYPDRVLAHDILQETNVVLWEKLEQFQIGTNFKAWAFRIAYLQTLAFLKKRKREQWIGFSSSLVAQLAIESSSVLEDFESRQTALRECLKKIPDGDALILRAHYLEQVPLAKLGAQLQRTAGALKQVLFRLRRSLRECVERRVQRGFDGV